MLTSPRNSDDVGFLMRFLFQAAWSFLAFSTVILYSADDFPVARTVSTLADSGPGSLREAIAQSQELAMPTRITSSLAGTIVLSNSLPTIVTPVWLELGAVTVSGALTSSVLNIQSTQFTRITGLTVAKMESDHGAPVVNRGQLLLENCVFWQNINAGGRGGAIFNAGHLIVTNCSILGNQGGYESGDGEGGGIYQEAGNLEMADSLVISNRVIASFHNFAGSTYYGVSRGAGAYIAGGRCTLNRVSICGNHHDNKFVGRPHGDGGGLWINGGEVFATNCTIAGNIAAGMNSFQFPAGGAVQTASAGESFGGGILVAGGSLTAVHCSIVQNLAVGGTGLNTGYESTPDAAGYGGGLLVRQPGKAYLYACIVAGNQASYAPDTHGDYNTGGANIVGNSSGSISFNKEDIHDVSGVVLPVKAGWNGQWYSDLPLRSAARDLVSERIVELDVLRQPRPTPGFADAGSYEAAALAPTITAEPAGQIHSTPLANATVRIAAEGSAELRYELVRQGNVLKSSLTPVFTLNSGDPAGTYQIRVTNLAGAAMSRPFEFTPFSQPEFSEQAAAQYAVPGSAIEFRARLDSLVPVAYRWFKDDEAIEGATNRYYRIASAEKEDLGYYRVEARAGGYTVRSAAATLAFSRVLNVSASQETGSSSLRGAIAEANKTPEISTLIVITNSGTLRIAPRPLEFASSIIVSNAAASFILTGESLTRLIEVKTNGIASFYNVTFTKGETVRSERGGAAWNDGDLTLTGCVFSENVATFGGAIFNRGKLAISRSSFFNNQAIGEGGQDGDGPGGGGAGLGGAIYSVRGTVALTNVTMSSNAAIGGNGGRSKNLPRGRGSRGGNTTSIEDKGLFGGGGAGSYPVSIRTFLGAITDYSQGNPAGFGGGGGGGHSTQPGWLYPPIAFTAGGAGGFGGADGPDPGKIPNAGGGGGIGGAIFLEGGEMELHHCTITQNRATGGGGGKRGKGISAGVFVYSGVAAVENTILTGNFADEYADLFGNLRSLGGNMFSLLPLRASSSDVVETDPLVAPLSIGSRLPAHELLPGSKGIDRALVNAGTFTDELGHDRFQGSAPDIGAIETPGVSTFMLRVKTAGAGEVRVLPERTFFSRGEIVTLTATPSPGSHFLRWASDAQGNSPSLSLSMGGSKLAEAIFSGPELYVETNGFGTVDISPARPRYGEGEIVEINPKAAPGWKFSHWSGDAEGSFDPYYLEATGSRLFTANFAPSDPFRVPEPFDTSERVRMTTAKFSPDGRPFLFLSDDVETQVLTMDPHGKTTVVARLSPEAMAATSSVGADGKIALFDSKSIIAVGAGGDELLRFNLPPAYIPGVVQIIPGGGIFAFARSSISPGGESNVLYSFSMPDGQLGWTNLVGMRRSEWAAAARGAGKRLLLSGGQAEELLLVSVLDTYHNVPYYLAAFGRESLVLSSSISVIAPDGTLKRIVHLPPFLYPTRVFPVSDGFICSGAAAPRSAGYPGLLETDANCFLAKLNGEGVIEWVRFGNADLNEESYGLPTAMFDCGISSDEKWIFVGIRSRKFRFAGREFAPGEVGPTYFLKFDFDGTLAGVLLDASFPGPAALGGSGDLFYAISPRSSRILRQGAPRPDALPTALRAVATAPGLDLLWPVSSGDMVLERRATLDPKEGWLPFPLSPRIRDGFYVVPKSRIENYEFYRLRER